MANKTVRYHKRNIRRYVHIAKQYILSLYPGSVFISFAKHTNQEQQGVAGAGVLIGHCIDKKVLAYLTDENIIEGMKTPVNTMFTTLDQYRPTIISTIYYVTVEYTPVPELKRSCYIQFAVSYKYPNLT